MKRLLAAIALALSLAACNDTPTRPKPTTNPVIGPEQAIPSTTLSPACTAQPTPLQLKALIANVMTLEQSGLITPAVRQALVTPLIASAEPMVTGWAHGGPCTMENFERQVPVMVTAGHRWSSTIH